MLITLALQFLCLHRNFVAYNVGAPRFPERYRRKRKLVDKLLDGKLSGCKPLGWFMKDKHATLVSTITPLTCVRFGRLKFRGPGKLDVIYVLSYTHCFIKNYIFKFYVKDSLKGSPGKKTKHWIFEDTYQLFKILLTKDNLKMWCIIYYLVFIDANWKICS